MPMIIDHEGELCVETEWSAACNSPERYCAAYPTGVPTREYPGLAGQSMRGVGEGVYLLTEPSYALPKGIRLSEGGKTLPVHTRTETLKPPRGGPWRYSRGEWVNTKTGKRRPAL